MLKYILYKRKIHYIATNRSKDHILEKNLCQKVVEFGVQSTYSTLSTDCELEVESQHWCIDS